MANELTPQFSSVQKGVTGSRPTHPALGQLYLDTTLDADGKPVWCSTEFVLPATPAVWVDATGAVV